MINAYSRRSLLLGALGLTALGASACSSSTATTSSTAASTAARGQGAMGGGSSSTSTAAAALASVASGFQQFSYADATTGKTLPYNLFIPEGYSASSSCPIVLYIADSSLVGQAVTAPLSQYGALVWGSDADQQKHESFVLVPEYPEIILDDHSGFTTTVYVEMTRRLLASVIAKYSIDTGRVYGTGQSMGCMTVMYLAAKYPDLFTAELFVSGQWDASVLDGLAGQKFVYIAAAGDANSTGGQQDVEKILTAADVAYATTSIDATWADARQEAAVKAALAKNDEHVFVNFAAGTVITANPSAGSMEHMASFEPAYKLTAARDWLFAQK